MEARARTFPYPDGRAIAAAVIAAALTLLHSSGPIEAQASLYTVTDLGSPGEIRSVGLGLNDARQAVGYSKTSAGTTRGFVFDGSAVRAVGTLGGRDSFAYAISNIGTVVGRAQTAAGEFHAFVMLPGGKLLDLTTLSTLFTGPYSTATSTSPSGMVVGYRLTPGAHMAGRSRIFLYADSLLKDLGTFGGQDAVAAAVNDAGQFAGFYSTNAHADYADRVAFVSGLDGNATQLGSLGGRLTTPTAINSAGQITGFGQLQNGDAHAFLYSGGQLVDLGTLGGRESFGYGLNDQGVVVGASESAAGSLRAFLYAGGQMIDLNTRLPAGSGWVVTEARDINATGAIVGTGVNGGRQRAVLLTPAQ
jgi:probable HAF family extracellular repeat protein